MDEDVQALLRQDRHRQAFERLLDRYETKVFRMAMMFLRDQGRAEETTQDIFLKLWQALPSYDGRAGLGTWLYTIARNTCLTVLRSESRRRMLSVEAVDEPASSAVPVDREVSGRIQVQRCLERLPEAQREVVTLFYLQDRDIEEVGRMLDLPSGTVKSHLHRARRTLAGMLKEER